MLRGRVHTTLLTPIEAVYLNYIVHDLVVVSSCYCSNIIVVNFLYGDWLKSFNTVQIKYYNCTGVEIKLNCRVSSPRYIINLAKKFSERVLQ